MPLVRVAQLDQSATVRRWEVAGAISAVDAISPLCLSSNRASFVNSYSSVQFRPGAPFYGDHDVRAASRPVKAFVPVRVRLVTPFGRAQALQRAVDRGLSRLGSSGLIPLRRFGGGGVTQAHRANSHGRSLARINSCAQNPFDGPKLWVIACCWFESNLLDKMGQKLKGGAASVRSNSTAFLAHPTFCGPKNLGYLIKR